MSDVSAELRLSQDRDSGERLVSGASLRKSVSWVVLGNVLFGFGNAALIVVIAKLGNPEMVGQFALGLAVSLPVTEFAKLGLRRVIVTDVKHEYAFGQYLWLRILTSILAFMAVAGVSYLAGYRGAAAMVIMAVALSKAFDSLSDIVYGLFQREERMELIALSMILRTVLSVLAMTGTLYFTRNLFEGVLAMAAAWGAIFLFFDCPIGRRIAAPTASANDYSSLPSLATIGRPSVSTGDRQNTRNWRDTALPLFRLMLISSPLGIALMLTQFNVNLPRYFIEWQLGINQLGLFAACAYVVQAGSLVVNSLGQAACPGLSRYFADSNENSFWLLLRRLVWLSALPGVLGWLGSLAFGRQGLVLFYGAEYADVVSVLQWLFAVGTLQFVALTLGHAMAAARLFTAQPLVLGVRSIITAIACFALIPKYGLVGAVWAYGAALLFQLILYWLALRRAVRNLRLGEDSPIATYNEW